MAIETNRLKTALILIVDAGMDELGKAITKTRTYSNVRESTTDQNLYDLATKIASLTDEPLEEVQKRSYDVLINVI